MSKRNVFLFLAVMLGIEFIREACTLKALGFDPRRFAEWVKGGDISG